MARGQIIYICIKEKKLGKEKRETDPCEWEKTLPSVYKGDHNLTF